MLKRIADPSPPLPVPLARPLPPDEIEPFLRSLVGLPPSEPPSGDDVAALGRGPSSPAALVDANAWIAWCLAGLHAAAVPPEVTGAQEQTDPWAPPIRAMVNAARRAAVVVAMVRHQGNLTRAAKSLGTSRRALRDALKDAGLYPWGAAPAVDTTSTTAADDAAEHGGQA